MIYLRLFEEFTSATGGLSYGGESGNVYNMPVSGVSTLGPNAIGNNVGSVDMNDADIEDDGEETSDEDNEEATDNQQKKKKSKIQTELEDSEEKVSDEQTQPVMDWDTYIKNNINKID